MSPLSWILWLLLGYLAAGVAVAAPFVARGLPRVDHAALGASRAVRLLLLPGAAALWPIVLWWWFGAIRRAGPAPARMARGMRSLRLAHALAWAVAAIVIGAGLAGALGHRARVHAPAPASPPLGEASP